jgi:RimJ/RimL family protein N-acetyltransferase
MPAFPELREPLTDGTVSVRPMAERDIPEILLAYQDDPQLHLRLGRDRPPSGAELGRYCERAAGERLSGRSLTLTVIDPGADSCRGQVSVHDLDWDHGRAELGIWVAPERRGEGLARRALVLAGRWLLGECGLQRVQILTEPGNEAMIAAARDAGFTFEGVLRGYTREASGRADAAVLSLVRPDLAA